MKRFFCVTLLLFIGVIAAQAQDIITKSNGDDIKAKVIEVNDTHVKYTIFDEPDGPVYTIKKSEIILITYQSGRRDTFKEERLFGQTSSYNANPYRTPAQEIRPGMKYKDLKHIYSYKNYSCVDESFNPALSGVCSWLIPGLGQAISGDIGRGFGWFGASVGCGVIMGIGGGLMGSDIGYTTGSQSAGAVLVVVGAIALITVDICAIVDAVRVAKVTNMYKEDLRSQRAYSLQLQPSLQYIPTASGAQPTAGFTLALGF